MGCLGKIFSSGMATACHQALVRKSETPARLAPAGVSGICCRLLRLTCFRPSTVYRVLRLPNVPRAPVLRAQRDLRLWPGSARRNGRNEASSSAESRHSEDLIRIECSKKCKHLWAAFADNRVWDQDPAFLDHRGTSARLNHIDAMSLSDALSGAPCHKRRASDRLATRAR